MEVILQVFNKKLLNEKFLEIDFESGRAVWVGTR